MKNKKISVKIPAGVESGTRIRVSGEGEAGVRGGPSGDLYVFISIKDHKLFQRDGADLHCEVPIRMTTAMLGGAFDIPGMDKNILSVKVPAGTQYGSQLRLRGKGMPIMKSGRFGDIRVHINVETPQNLTKKQKDLLAEFEENSSKSSSPKSDGFVQNLKKIFSL